MALSLSMWWSCFEDVFHAFSLSARQLESLGGLTGRMAASHTPCVLHRHPQIPLDRVYFDTEIDI